MTLRYSFKEPSANPQVIVPVYQMTIATMVLHNILTHKGIYSKSNGISFSKVRCQIK